MHQISKWVGIVAVICMAGIAGYVYMIDLSRRRVRENDHEILMNSPPVQVVSGKGTLCEREGWVPRDFFASPEAIRACELISARDIEGLRKVLDGGFKPKLSGKADMDLLLWAFVNDNLEAFKLLLVSGASPDHQLTRGIDMATDTGFGAGDSILFTTLRSRDKRKWEFFFAALEYTDNINQRDAHGNTLLLVCLGGQGISSTNEGSLQRLLRSGVELDAQNEFGDTAALVALGWDRPLFSLRILEAGAVLDIRDRSGKTVADRLASKLMQPVLPGAEYRFAEYNRLKAWLDAHRTESVEQ